MNKNNKLNVFSNHTETQLGELYWFSDMLSKEALKDLNNEINKRGLKEKFLQEIIDIYGKNPYNMNKYLYQPEKL